MRRTHSAGGVVLNAEGAVAVVSQRGKSWSLPKGHRDGDEALIETAKREIAEETGLTQLTCIQELGTYERPKMTSEDKDGHDEMKVMTFFLFTTRERTLSPHDKDNPEAQWVPLEDVASRLTHPKDKTFFRKIMPLVEGYIKNKRNPLNEKAS